MKNNNTFLSEINFNMSQLNLSHMRKISAVPVSLYSDPELDKNKFWDITIRRDVRNNPRKLLSLLVLISYVKPFWYSYFIDFVMNQCQRYNYQGMWRNLHKLAKLQHFELISYRIQEIMSPNAFFGNYFQEIKQFSKNCPCIFSKLNKPKPKTIQRRRGYNDKGSMKLPHERHDFSEVSGANPVKEDYRSQYKKRSALLNFLYG